MQNGFARRKISVWRRDRLLAYTGCFLRLAPANQSGFPAGESNELDVMNIHALAPSNLFPLSPREELEWMDSSWIKVLSASDFLLILFIIGRML